MQLNIQKRQHQIERKRINVSTQCLGLCGRYLKFLFIPKQGEEEDFLYVPQYSECMNQSKAQMFSQVLDYILGINLTLLLHQHKTTQGWCIRLYEQNILRPYKGVSSLVLVSLNSMYQSLHPTMILMLRFNQLGAYQIYSATYRTTNFRVSIVVTSLNIANCIRSLRLSLNWQGLQSWSDNLSQAIC